MSTISPMRFSSRLTRVMALDTLPKEELIADKKQILWAHPSKQPRSGSERKAMGERLETIKQAGPSARMLVCPARVGGDHVHPNCAGHLCKLLSEAKLCRGSVAKAAPLMGSSGWPNKMHVLWLFARSAREYLRQHRADSDYALFADYWFNPGGPVWAVHFGIYDQGGEWVIADLQNNHHEDFQRIDPKTLEGCDRLVLERLRHSYDDTCFEPQKLSPSPARRPVAARTGAGSNEPRPADRVPTSGLTGLISSAREVGFVRVRK